MAGDKFVLDSPEKRGYRKRLATYTIQLNGDGTYGWSVGGREPIDLTAVLAGEFASGGLLAGKSVLEVKADIVQKFAAANIRSGVI